MPSGLVAALACRSQRLRRQAELRRSAAASSALSLRGRGQPGGAPRANCAELITISRSRERQPNQSSPHPGLRGSEGQLVPTGHGFGGTWGDCGHCPNRENGHRTQKPQSKSREGLGEVQTPIVNCASFRCPARGVNCTTAIAALNPVSNLFTESGCGYTRGERLEGSSAARRAAATPITQPRYPASPAQRSRVTRVTS